MRSIRRKLIPERRTCGVRTACRLSAILAGHASTVLLAPGMELCNAASGRQHPRVRLRVRGAMVPLVRQSVAVSSAAAMQWRANGPGNAASLGAGRMSPQQMRQMSLHAGEARLPGALAVR